MNKISFTDFRCFKDEQNAALAPLTLLVGDNGTGKTSLLALVRALWRTAFLGCVPDFTEDPYDLGCFDEIAHYGSEGRRADSFKAAFEIFGSNRNGAPLDTRTQHIEVTFGKDDGDGDGDGAAPTVSQRLFKRGEVEIKEYFDGKKIRKMRIRTTRGSWDHEFGIRDLRLRWFHDSDHPGGGEFSASKVLVRGNLEKVLSEDSDFANRFIPLNDSPDIASQDLQDVRDAWLNSTCLGGHAETGPCAIPAMRSAPFRAYNPAGLETTLGSENNFAVNPLNRLSFINEDEWAGLKQSLENFGRNSGLFDEINAKRLLHDKSSFHLQVRKSGERYRNLVDAGYGVSQVLPTVVALLSQRSVKTFLLEQPEAHLHPSAQAALGSFFCELAGRSRNRKQILVETHSDHLLDRVRMDVRDKKTGLTHDQISILFFERDGLDVHIHSLRLDEEGNVLNVPNGYRRFFMEETRRSLQI